MRWFELNSGWSLELLEKYAAEHNGKWVPSHAANWKNSDGRWSAVHSADVLKSLRNDLFLALGDLPMGDDPSTEDFGGSAGGRAARRNRDSPSAAPTLLSDRRLGYRGWAL